MVKLCVCGKLKLISALQSHTKNMISSCSQMPCISKSLSEALRLISNYARS